MTRMTDEFMADLEAKHAKIENDYRPTCATVNYGNGCPGATDDSTAFWRAAVDCVPAMLTEIRERRALDLSAEDRDALASFADRYRCEVPGCRMGICNKSQQAIAVIDRLLGERAK